MSKLENLKRKAFKNKAVKREYDKLEHEFALIDQLLRIRANSGLTQEEVASRMGTSSSNISRLESGASNPTWQTIQKYAIACGQNGIELRAY